MFKLEWHRNGGVVKTFRWATQVTSLLRFTNPNDIPIYGDWDFKVYPARITLRSSDMLAVYRQYIENHHKYHSTIPKEWPRYTEFQRVSELAERLQAACDTETDIDFESADYLWSFSSGLMFDRKFVSVYCPECDRDFAADQCKVVDWSYGSGLAAHGGQRVECPQEHTLYSCMQWNS
ncbi:hypothetical protein [Rhodopirellula bahusiensis]|uniref:hypothetical protein n=1 Tax=Rhodopirellula bahusiensis TaxID=2014065 RepID=UPI001179986D|nr:hypothetical protein [Rhodopirellula bahusiensis]